MRRVELKQLAAGKRLIFCKQWWFQCLTEEFSFCSVKHFCEGTSEVRIDSTPGREGPSLRMSRAFGDFYFKQNNECSQQQQAICALPDVLVVPRTSGYVRYSSIPSCPIAIIILCTSVGRTLLLSSSVLAMGSGML